MGGKMRFKLVYFTLNKWKRFDIILNLLKTLSDIVWPNFKALALIFSKL